MRLPRSCRPALALLAALVIGSCDGGGVGGTGGISGFGSIFVNGVEWFIEGAEITLDGEPGTEAELQLGMVVGFKGHTSGSLGQASEVFFDDAVQGPVDAIVLTSPVTKELDVLGRTVVVDEQLAVFDETDPGFGFDTLSLGEVIEVSGHEEGDGTIRATWLRRLGPAVMGQSQVELEGTVTGLVPGTSFQLGPILVEIDGQTELEELPGLLADGMVVEAEGVLTAPAAILADRVGAPAGLPAGIAEANVEGVVAGFSNLAAFEVAGVPVDASQAELDPPDPTLLANGSLVQVEGPLEAGVILAEKVRIDVVEVELKAALATAGDVDPLAGTIVVAGVAGRLAADAELADELYDTADFDLWDLQPGDFLALRGSFAGSGELVIDKLERRATGNVVIRGAVTGFDAFASTVSVLGASVPISPETEIEDDTDQPLSPSDFFATVGLGDVVVVVDEDDGDATSIDIADAIELD